VEPATPSPLPSLAVKIATVEAVLSGPEYLDRPRRTELADRLRGIRGELEAHTPAETPA
jgi:hypothetical protein